MQYAGNEAATMAHREDTEQRFGTMTTSAGICFGAPDEATDREWRDAQPAAARAADEQD